ncbi:MAG: SMI1/KNR4 family protein [Azoarcus sp.]|nr:SMI1/KNR4 family protein [Azoarcus sp.]
MNKIFDLLKRAYATDLAADVRPETEEAACAFEEKHGVTLPADYRLLLTTFGAFNFGNDPWLYSLEDLEWAHPSFVETYKEYREGYPDLPDDLDPFPIGGFGEGSIAVLDRATGKIFMLIHDCAEDVPLEDVADSFEGFIRRQAENLLEYMKTRQEKKCH